MRKLMLWGSVTCFMLVSSYAAAQTIDKYKLKSDGLYYRGRYDSALYYARLAEPLIIDSFGKNSSVYAYFIGQYFSMPFEKMQIIDSALFWYQSSVQLFENLNDTASNEYGETLTNTGNLLNTIGSYTEAFPYLKRAVAVMRNYPANRSGLIGSINNLGNYYNYCGEYSDAINNYQECLTEIAKNKTGIGQYQIGALLHNLASIYTKTGNTKEAEVNFKLASDTLRKVPTAKFEYYETNKDFAGLYIATNKIDKAEVILNEVLNDGYLAKHNGQNPQDLLAGEYAEALNSMGNVKEAQKKYPEAENFYNQAIIITNKLTVFPAAKYSSKSCLAHLYSNTNRTIHADSLYTWILEEFGKEKNIDHYYFSEIYAAYCENLIRMNQMQKAANKIQVITKKMLEDLYRDFPGMSEDKQLQYATYISQYINLIFSTFANSKFDRTTAIKFALNNLLQSKGMTLSYQARKIQILRVSSDTGLTSMYRKWVAIRQILYNDYMNKTMNDPINKTKISINREALESEANYYDKQIALKTGTQIETLSSSPSDDIKNRLQARETAIEFVRYKKVQTNENMYGAFVMQGGKDPDFIELCSEKDLRKAMKAKNHFDPANQLKNHQAIYRLIWKPMAEKLTSVAKSSIIYYCPDGLLNYISFDAIASAPSKYLLNANKLVLLSSSRNLLRHSANATQKFDNAELWGNIDYSEKAYLTGVADVASNSKSSITKGLQDIITKNGTEQGFPPLKDDEIPTIVGLAKRRKLSYRLYEKETATEENFKKNALFFHGLLHISTHGFYYIQKSDTGFKSLNSNSITIQPNPLLRCGLVLNGGNYFWSGKIPPPNKEDAILTGYEIAMMDLSKVNLVVLSACETGLGDIDAGNEGVLGLQRAFKLAGVNKMVVSLWSVNAKATKELMTIFYQNMLSKNQLPQDALRNAKITMSKNNPPYSWAGFVLVE